MTDNIFSYQGERKDLADEFYELFVTDKAVSYQDVLTEYKNFNVDDLETSYKTLKYVVPEEVKTLQKYGYTVLLIPNGKSTSYQYLGKDKDSLKNVRFKTTLKSDLSWH